MKKLDIIVVIADAVARANETDLRKVSEQANK